MKNGDLIFLVSDSSAFSKAIADSTSEELQLDHVGIVEIGSDGKINVIEAKFDEGVTVTHFEDFLERAPKCDGIHQMSSGWLVRRVPLTSGVDVDKAVERAKTFVGLKYNKRFLPCSDALYCSELVQKCYLMPDGSPYFDSVRMEFYNDNSACKAFWSEYFAAMDMEVPQGESGTSPMSIYRLTVT